jgi:hypothetical protein
MYCILVELRKAFLNIVLEKFSSQNWMESAKKIRKMANDAEGQEFPGHLEGVGGLYGEPQSRQSAKPFLQSSESGLPQPPTRVPPTLRFRGEGHTRWRERGWGSPNSDEGTSTVELFIYMYFVRRTISDEDNRGFLYTIVHPPPLVWHKEK